MNTSDVARLTGATLRELQWWDENRIIVPARTGHLRDYGELDILRVRVLVDLRGRGCPLAMARLVVKRIGSGELPAFLFVTDTRLLEKSGRVDWKHRRDVVQVLPSHDEDAMRLMAECESPVWVVNIGALRAAPVKLEKNRAA